MIPAITSNITIQSLCKES